MLQGLAEGSRTAKQSMVNVADVMLVLTTEKRFRSAVL